MRGFTDPRERSHAEAKGWQEFFKMDSEAWESCGGLGKQRADKGWDMTCVGQEMATLVPSWRGT